MNVQRKKSKHNENYGEHSRESFFLAKEEHNTYCNGVKNIYPHEYDGIVN